MSIQCFTADSEALMQNFDTSAYGIATRVHTPKLEDRFATMPEIPVISVTYQQPNEEELHTSFEQAISDRVLAFNKQLSFRSGSLAHNRYAQPCTESLQYSNPMALIASVPVQQQQQATPFSFSLGNIWRRSIIFGSLAFMFMLTGFDLMGLLVLHVH